MIIDNLPTIPSTVTTGDEFPVERGTTTYKIDYNALETAILDKALIRPATPVTFGGSEDAFSANIMTLLENMAAGESRTISTYIDAETDNFTVNATYYGTLYKINSKYAAGIMTDNTRSTVLIGRNGSDIVDFGALTKNAVAPVKIGGTGATTPIGALANLCTGIPVSAYSLPTYAANVQALDQNNGVRCIKYGNGMKRIMGVMSISGTLASDGLMLTLPNDFNYLSANNGGIQGWTAMFGGSKSWIVRISGTGVYSWEGSAIPAANYILDFCYF